VPVEVNTPGGSISRLVRSFPGLFIAEVDGRDFLQSYDALRYAAEYCRGRQGPALVHARVIRPYSHSNTDDESLYRPKEERERDAARDPVRTMAGFLTGEGILSEEALEKLKAEVDEETNAAADRALAARLPEPDSASEFVYCPTWTRLRPPSRRRRPARARPDHDGGPHQRLPERRNEARSRDRRLR
jgi:2-oxoisovalerate dehydrogenase E1 component